MANGVEVLSDATTAPASEYRAVFHAQSRAGRLCLQFVPRPGNDFLVNSLVVEGDAGSALQSLFVSAPPVTLPSAHFLHLHASNDKARALERVCDWLSTPRRSDAYIGDAWSKQFSSLVHCLNAGARGWPATTSVATHRYRDAAFAALDAFAAEQLPNGAFMDGFRSRPTFIPQRHRGGTPDDPCSPAHVRYRLDGDGAGHRQPIRRRRAPPALRLCSQTLM